MINLVDSRVILGKPIITAAEIGGFNFISRTIVAMIYVRVYIAD